jgi:hypothetical protein
MASDVGDGGEQRTVDAGAIECEVRHRVESPRCSVLQAGAVQHLRPRIDVQVRTAGLAVNFYVM